MRVFTFSTEDDTENGSLEQDDIETYSPPCHYIQDNKKDIWGGSYIPALTMSACTTMNDTVYLFGGFNCDTDSATEDLWKITGLNCGDPDVTLIAGPKTVRDSLWTDAELLLNGCLTQEGSLPGII